MGCWLGLVGQGADTTRLGVALGLLAWTVLIVLAFLEGMGFRILSLSVVGIHVRFLVAIPLMFLCETWVIPRMTEFSNYLVRSGLVPTDSLPTLAIEIRRVTRLKDSWLAEGLFVFFAFALPLMEMIVPLASRTGSWVTVLKLAGSRLPLATGWYLGFCLPLFRFLLLRWVWRLGIWWYFLWRVQKLDLRMFPTHSDSTAGLGYLDIVHENFAPLIVAISAIISAQFAEEIYSGTMAFEALYAWGPIVILLIAALFIAPLFMFCNKLWICRVNGMREYMTMATHYVNAFDTKWIRNQAASGESQLGSADLQSLADLTNSVNIVRGMRWIPISRRLTMQLSAAAIVPLLPLIFLKYPVDRVVVKLFQMLTGL